MTGVPSSAAVARAFFTATMSPAERGQFFGPRVAGECLAPCCQAASPEERARAARFNEKMMTKGFAPISDTWSQAQIFSYMMKHGAKMEEVERKFCKKEKLNPETMDERPCGLSSCSNKAAKKCSRCRAVYYCSEACNDANWKNHKKNCKKVDKLVTGKEGNKATTTTTASNGECGLSSCSNKGSLKCSGCGAVQYCSKVCGQANWKLHKKNCKKTETQATGNKGEAADDSSTSKDDCGLASCSNRGILGCSACHAVSYCSKSCGKANWKVHKKDCTFKK